MKKRNSNKFPTFNALLSQRIRLSYNLNQIELIALSLSFSGFLFKINHRTTWSYSCGGGASSLNLILVKIFRYHSRSDS